MLASAALSAIELRDARTGSPPAFRAVCAIVMVLALLTAGYGLYFPPHILLYAGVAIAGVAALLRFANEIEDAGGEWPHTDTIGREGWHYQLRATMAAAIEALIKTGTAVHS